MTKKQTEKRVGSFADEKVIQGWLQYMKTGKFPVQKATVGSPERIVYLPDIFAHPEIDRDYIKAIRSCYVEVGQSLSDAIDVTYCQWAASCDGNKMQNLGSSTFKMLECVFDAVFEEAVNSACAPDNSSNTAFEIAIQHFEEYATGIIHRLPSPSYAWVYWAHCTHEAVKILRGFRWNMHLLSKRFGELDGLYGTNGRSDLVNSTACWMKADWRKGAEIRQERDNKGPSPDMVETIKRVEGIFVDRLVNDPCLMNAMEQTLQQIAAEAA